MLVAVPVTDSRVLASLEFPFMKVYQLSAKRVVGALSNGVGTVKLVVASYEAIELDQSSLTEDLVA
jgi:hypothetical protein